MVPLSLKTRGVRVSHTTRYGIRKELKTISPQRDRSCAEKHTERDTSSVTYKITYEAPDVSRPSSD